MSAGATRQEYWEITLIKKLNMAVLAAVLAALALMPVPGTSLAAQEAAAQAQPASPGQPASKEYSEQGLLDAAYNFCATVQNRDGKSCGCEQKLLKDPKRFDPEAREMAFYYFTDKDRYLKEFKARIAADPKWQEGFSLRMSQMQALMIAACGA